MVEPAPPIDRSRIRVKAMLVAPNAQRTAHAVSVNAATAENPGGYHRLIGGSVELGETHIDAVRREVREELSATIRDLSYLGVVENIFRIDGEVGHEIVFLYTGTLDPEPAATGATLTESDGAVVPVVWRNFDDDAEALPLYPAGVVGLFVQR
ncbi:NUDIX hydrolase [Microbacterium sp. MYb62]|uniref:NUDIX hydrolase n=1 Tax=Microbacterium sp. MYb62 TaxID=1848690 RepID=UPI0021573DCD|nr:NUDIX domain-containing protein [Microbacterium sp. MYb62]